MCTFYSGLILRERVLLAPFDGNHSHEPLIREAGMRDSIEPEFIRVECVPQGALDSVNPKDWKVNIDQDYLPEWFRGKGKKALIDDFKTRVLEVIGGVNWKKLGGYLDLRGTQIKSLPSGLKVGGNLYLRGTQIKSLPSGLKVGGYLDLYGTQIKSLPSGLKVGGNLDLRGTQIKSLPSGLKVGGYLYLRGTQIELIAAAQKKNIAYHIW